MGKACSRTQQRERLVRSLRASGASWVEVAAMLQRRYRFNVRVALRYAHGWSQRRLADEWNRRWPDELKNFKIFSLWEQWPSSTEHAPSLASLSKLAELYECAVSDLLSDVPGFRHLDTATGPSLGHAAQQTPATHPNERASGGAAAVTAQQDQGDWDILSPLVGPRDAAPLVQRLEEVDFADLVRVIVVWMQQLNPSASRRDLLSKLSAACAVAAIAPLFDVINPEERERLARVLQHPESFDLAALAYCERMIVNLRQQDNALGPQLTLHSAIGHRQMAQRLA